MANSGSFNTTGYQGRYLQFAWSIPDGGQDISGNKTKINWTLKGAGQAESGYYLSGNFKVVIDGTVVFQSATRIQLRNGTVVASGSVTLSHGSDGAKSFSASAEAGIYNVAVNCSGSGSWALPSIARASAIDSAANITLGNMCSVRWTPKHKDFGYKLRFSLGSWNYTTGVIVPNTTGAYTYAGYTVPLEAANQIPSSKTGTMTVALYSYTDSNGTTQIGSASTKTFTVTVPNSAGPKVAMTLSPVSSLGTAFASLYIQRLSKVKASFSGSAGQYGATIKSYAFVVGGVRYASPYQSNWLSLSGQVEVKGLATDSRGYSTEVTQYITVIPYDSPAVVPYTGDKKIVCARCLSNGTLSRSGTYLKIRAGRSFSKVSTGGVQKNFCMLGYRYVVSGGTLPSTYTSLIAKTDTADVIDIVVPNVTLALTSSYTVQLYVVDDTGESSTLTFAIPTETVTLHLKKNGKGVGIGKYAEEDELFDVGWNTTFRKSINGCYFKRIAVENTNILRIQTMWPAFDTGATRQTIFIFGVANVVPVHGMVTVNKAGEASWSGTENVTVAGVTGGIVEITLPTTAWDVFMAISAKLIEIA